MRVIGACEWWWGRPSRCQDRPTRGGTQIRRGSDREDYADPALTMIQYQKEGQSSIDAPIVWPDVYKTGDAIYVGQ